MRAREAKQLAKAIETIRNPGGDGKTQVSHGFSGHPMTCVRCHLPTKEQVANVVVLISPRCAC